MIYSLKTIKNKFSTPKISRIYTNKMKYFLNSKSIHKYIRRPLSQLFKITTHRIENEHISNNKHDIFSFFSKNI